MGLQLKIIAASDAPVQLSTDTTLGFRGLAGIMNETTGVKVACLCLPNATPSSVQEVWRGGTAIVCGAINQVQDLTDGNIPYHYWVAATSFGPMPGDTINAGEYCATPQNDVATFVTEPFTLPAINSTVQITVLDTSAFAIGNYADRTANTGVFCGGRFWDIVSLDSATTMTLRLRDVFGAVVTMLG